MSPRPDFDDGFRTVGNFAEMEVAEANQMFLGSCPGNGVGPKFFPTNITSEEGAYSAGASSSCSQFQDQDCRNPTARINDSSKPRKFGVIKDHQRMQNSQSQVALTQAALEAWGKQDYHMGKEASGKDIREHLRIRDPGYTKWILSRISNLGEDMEDYANYAMTRRHLEEAALKHRERPRTMGATARQPCISCQG